MFAINLQSLNTAFTPSCDKGRVQEVLETRSRRILVVEDDADIATMLEHHLTQERYEVTLAKNGEAAIEALRDTSPDLVLLDLMLPDMSGFEVLKELRRVGPAPESGVIILTARKDEVDRILGFELGADDFVLKPFSPRELLLRIRVVLRRRGRSARPAPSPERTGSLRAGPIEISPDQHQAWADGKPLDLTLTEFRLLTEIVRAGGRVRSRESLLSEVWGYDAEVMSRTVDTHIRRLRGKLGGSAPWLATVRGIGYRIQDPGK